MMSFKILQSLGRGGFGEVFVCERESDGSRFAMKRLLSTSDSDTVARFQREIRLLSNLDHPNVVRVIAKNLSKEPYYYVMPLYDHSLQHEIPSLVGDETRIPKIFTAVLDAMDYAHREDVIHRDLKPANILMNDDSNLVVADFGIGRQLDSESTRQTVSGFGLGTALYMAPEQWRDAKHADARADIYSLGRVLYELYSGPLTDMGQDIAKVPSGIEFLVNRCTNQDPEKRFQTVASLKLAYRTLLDAPPDHGELQELMDLQTRLSVPSNYDSNELERFLLLFLKHHQVDDDLLSAAMMTLHAEAIADLHRLEPDAIKQLVEQFCEDTASRNWGFSYTDDIAKQCQYIFHAVDDPEIRAMLTACVASVGTNHNRWFVMQVAANLIQHEKTPAERLALLERLQRLEPWILVGVGEFVKVTKLDPVLLPLLKPDGESAEPP